MLHRASAVAVVLLCVAAAPARAADPTELFFSEYIEGTSNNKALEIYNGTGAAVNLAAGGYNVQMHFNGNPVATLTINLTGTVAAGGVYVLAHSSAAAEILAVANQTNGAGWFNGDDAVVLRRGTTVVDVIGQIGFDPGSEWGSGLTSTADNTLRRKNTVTAGDTNGADAFDPSLEWDGFATNTFDGLGGGIVPPPDPELLSINEIQGDGAFSPHQVLVETRGNVVTAVGPTGFFIQMPDALADLDDLTSNGLFVFTGAPPSVLVGDEVTVIGTVTEFFDLTEISGTVEVEVTATGLPLPAHVVFDATRPSPTPLEGLLAPELERYEGMLVRVEDAVVSGPTDRFGDTVITSAPERPFREPGILFPGLPGLPVWDGNPEVFDIDFDGLGRPDAAVAAGGRVSAEGALSFAFGDYSLWPTSYTIVGGDAEVRAVRARDAGEMSVAGQNMLRLFQNENDPNTPENEYQVRLEKLSLQVRHALGGPDVLAVQEVGTLEALQDLAARIHADDASLTYSAHLLEGNDIGGIDVGFLVRDTVRVDAIEQFGADVEFAPGDPLNDRPPLILRGAYTANGKPFPITVIDVHQRSLSGIEGSSSNAARVRAKRLRQAEELAGLLQDEQANGARVVVLGDFNAFEFTDGYVDVMGIVTGNLDPAGALLPGMDLVDPNYTNWTFALPAGERYSFVFDGSAQSLDHVLTSTATDEWVRGMEHARGNADAPAAFATVAGTALRSADHDGSVLFLMTDEDADGIADDVDACHGTQLPEGISRRLLPNHSALIDGDGVFEVGAPNGPGLAFTLDDTRGCSCTQIAAALGLGKGHTRFGCAPEVMTSWVAAQ
jgi:predicted extracellular nuclease